jgi:hypothetical protein
MLRHKKAMKKEFFEKITINREVVVQEAGFTTEKSFLQGK